MIENFKGRGGVWVLVQNALTLAVLITGISSHQASTPAWMLVIAWACLVTGALAGIAGVRALGKNLSPFPKPLAQGSLVRHGVYRLVRHPLYASLLWLCAGWSALFFSLTALAATGVLAVVLDRKARIEEAWLRERFHDYEAYQRRVKRFLPWIY